MNRYKVKEFPCHIYSVKLGSREYGFHLDNSDNDTISIYCILRDDAFDDPEYYFREIKGAYDSSYLELSRLHKMILGGYPEIGDIFWGELTYRTNIFETLKSIRHSLISKKTLKQWIEFSARFYSNSKKAGAMGNKTAIDFCTVIGKPHIKGTHGWPLTECIERNSFDLNQQYPVYVKITERMLSLEPIVGIENVYSLFRGFADVARPIIDLDGNIQTFDNANYGQYMGVIIYDKKGHQEYKERYKTRIVRGYSPKSMAHAFRVLERTEIYCKEADVKIKVQKPEFYRDILKGNDGGEYYFSLYEKRFNEVSDLVQNSTFTENINNILLTRTMEEVRDKVEEILVKIERVN